MFKDPCNNCLCVVFRVYSTYNIEEFSFFISCCLVVCLLLIVSGYPTLLYLITPLTSMEILDLKFINLMFPIWRVPMLPLLILCDASWCCLIPGFASSLITHSGIKNLIFNIVALCIMPYFSLLLLYLYQMFCKSLWKKASATYYNNYNDFLGFQHALSQGNIRGQEVMSCCSNILGWQWRINTGAVITASTQHRTCNPLSTAHKRLSP